jgi:alpha-ribazole phosphatase/probable phosphoglycerate mutase
MGTTDNHVTTIDLMRHGEPVGGKKYRGQIDDPLSEKGWHQMRNAIGEHCPWDVIVSSSLCRCADFAKELADKHALPLELDDRLVELGFGDWEGRTAEELKHQDPDCLHRFWSDPLNNRPTGAETLADFCTRVISAWADVTNTFRGKHILMVGHAGMIRMVVRHILDMPLDRLFRIQVPSASVTRIQIDHHSNGDLPRLIFHGGSLND